MRGVVACCLALVVACAHGGAPAPAPAVTAPVVRAEAEDEAARAQADAAAERLAVTLREIHDRCRASWSDDDAECGAARFRAIAEEYAAYYGTHDDPRGNDGRIDALPRLGAGRAPVDVLVARIAAACAAGCGIERRAAVGVAVGEAIEACVGRAGPRACADLARKRADGEGARSAVAYCEKECDARRARAHEEAEIERNRPRNRAERIDCIRGCRGDAHLEIDADGTPRAVSHGWCGTDAMSCEHRCAIR